MAFYNKYLMAVFIMSITTAFAQVDEGGKRKIKGADIILPDDTDNTPKFDLWKKPDEPVKKFDFETKKKGVDLTQQNDFVKPKVNMKSQNPRVEGKGSHERFKKDQYFGEFKTNSTKVRLICRDHENVDGDKVQIIHNDKIIAYEVLLIGEFKAIDIDLAPGFNKFEVIALNEGLYSPNTAEFRVVDDSGKTIIGNIWNMASGYKASMIIIKDTE